MHPQFPHILTKILLLAIAGLIPATAESGYVRVTDAKASSLSSAHCSGATSKATGDRRIAHDYAELGFLGHSGGASAPSPASTSSAGVSVAILPSTDLLGDSQLVLRIGPAGKVFLPSPFSNGVFRPPRFVV